MSIEHNKTHFGYQTVTLSDKTRLVNDVFVSVADKYDLMNDVMSFGMHRIWKKLACEKAALRPGHQVLDLASGTGDLAKRMVKRIGKAGRVILSDINQAMLNNGRDNLLNAGILKNVDYVLADAQKLPFKTNHFDRITIAFGLRNVTDKEAALSEMYRCTKPGGQLLILEFSHPTEPLIEKLYEYYSFYIIPAMGEHIANDRRSYQYLVESIRMHPNQLKLSELLNEAGFEDVTYTNLNHGIVAIHTGWKY